MILASKNLLQSLSANCVRGCYSSQYCVACCDAGEFTSFIAEYQFRNFEVGPSRDKTLPSLTSCARNASDTRSHWPIRDFGYEYFMGASSS